MRTLTNALRQDALTDPLTGLANRRDLGRELALLRAGDAVIVLDIDHFKQLNDRLGHMAGDEVLADLGRTIRRWLRPTDTAIRLGGEEMLLLMPGAGTPGANEALRRLADSWATLHPNVTFSAGVCVVEDEAAIDPLTAADLALYEAKADGKNCWKFALCNSGTPQRAMTPSGLDRTLVDTTALH